MDYDNQMMTITSLYDIKLEQIDEQEDNGAAL